MIMKNKLMKNKLCNYNIYCFIFLDVTADYSDHALWWPEKKIWLTKARLSLSSYGIINDTQLLFTPQHKSIRLQMPDLQLFDMKINFAVDVLHTVSELCNELGIRHSAELSLMRPYETGTAKKRKKMKKGAGSATGSDDASSQGSTGNGTLGREPKAPSSPNSNRLNNSYHPSDTLNPYSTAMSPMLAHSPNTVTQEQLENIGLGKSVTERANISCGWLSSSESLMQQVSIFSTFSSSKHLLTGNFVL